MGNETELEKALKARAAAKGWTLRAVKNLQKCLSQPACSQLELDDAVADFDKRASKYEAAQTEVECHLPEADLDAYIEEAADYLDSLRPVRLAATHKLVELCASVPPAPVAPASTVGSSDGKVKLPTLKLPTFSGVLVEWQAFWDRFVALVGDSDLPAVSKFSYLQSVLTGEANSVVQGLALTAANYPVACQLLKERFGRPERIIFAHIQALLNLDSLNSKGVKSLWKLQDQLLTHIRSLDALGIKGTDYGVFLTPVILSRLPSEIRLEWSREGSGHESDLAFLLTFLQKEIERRERSDSFKDSCFGSVAASESRTGKGQATASALQSASTSGCGVCGKRHRTEKCWTLQKLTVKDRFSRIKNAKLCFKCLATGHMARECDASCENCNGHHHKLLCSVDSSSAPSSTSGNNVTPVMSEQPTSVNIDVSSASVCSCNVTHDHEVSSVLQTARVLVDGDQAVEATLMFDTGSDRSYISSDLVRKVRPKWVSSEPILYSAFGGRSHRKVCDVYNLRLRDKHGGSQSLHVAEIQRICSPLQRARVPENIIEQLGISGLADEYSHERCVTVDILVGMDHYWEFVNPARSRKVDSLVAQDSVFGWLLSGSFLGGPSRGNSVSPQLLCPVDVSESTLGKFWDLESVGIRPDESVDSVSDKVLEEFTSSVKLVNGRYEVSLPWRSEDAKAKLLNNHGLARKRLEVLSSKLDRNLDLKTKYDNSLRELELNDMIEEVPLSVSGSPVFYMPHHPVVRESSVTTKVRPVFDASAPSYNGVSLNDCMEAGPCLLPNLVEVLVRFRRWKYAFTADITKAFLQIQVNTLDRDVHRFLWNCDGSTRVMRFTRVPFGNKSSPFLLNATIKHHLSSYQSSKTVIELQDNLYVDDWLSGADTEDDACKMFGEARQILAEASMPLAKCSSNCQGLVDKFVNEHNMSFLENDVKILGLKWNAGTDCFLFDGVGALQSSELVPTKRMVLSMLSRIFDPLGLVNPYTMFVKILFQDIWRLGLDWDDSLPGELVNPFRSWVRGLDTLKHWSVPRSYTSNVPWGSFNNQSLEIHGFGDASEKGYGACVYIRTIMSDGSFHSSLVISKGRVAPLKKVTLPRLELLAALLCARLVRFVYSALRLDESIAYRCWTDSQVALAWIRGDPSKWKTFVANRVSEIQELTAPMNWSHCLGRDNPADLLTRGVMAQQLMSSNWLSGPEWLTDEDYRISDLRENSDNSAIQCELATAQSCITLVSGRVDPVFDFERWSSFDKAIRIVAWVRRFIHNCRSVPKIKGDLSLDELSQAKSSILLNVQQCEYTAEIETLKAGRAVSKSSSLYKLDPMLGSDGLLRVKGRLQLSDLSYASKHPIILPSCHLTELLVRSFHVSLKHAGVSAMISSIRDTYWIVGLRRIAKRVSARCVPCRKVDSQACNQPGAPLPEDRVKSSPPFTITGMDYAGPLFCVDFPKVKFYILLFTCAVVRAVHLELTHSLAVDDCILAIRRFSARRGMPAVFYTDNAKTFTSVAKKVKHSFGVNGPRWNFIVPRSPWWGGWWERLVRSVKSALRKCIGVSHLTRVELETVLLEIESCINSRPISFVGDDIEYSKPLTPSLFLIGRNAGLQSNMSIDVDVNSLSQFISAADLTVRDAERQSRLEEFWRSWSDDYIRNLPPIVRGFSSYGNIKTGMVVLIREDCVKRMAWPLALVVEVYPSKDGVVRSCKLKTSKGFVTRSIQRLHKLEVP